MINIEKIFFCDNIENGQYGKLNITGLISTDILKWDKKIPELVIKDNWDITKTSTGAGVFPYVWIKVEKYKELDEELSSKKEKLDKNLKMKN